MIRFNKKYFLHKERKAQAMREYPQSSATIYRHAKERRIEFSKNHTFNRFERTVDAYWLW